MALISHMVALGTPAPAFTLPSVDGAVDSGLNSGLDSGGGRATEAAMVRLGDFAGAPALLVMFLSNHCPYVRHVEDTLGTVVGEYAESGLASVAICSNDVTNYPDDAPGRLDEQRRRAGFTFPYLYDASQEAARAYHAACTPDFFLYDADRRLAYRGQLDDARPGNDVPVTGDALRQAIEQVLAGRPVPGPHKPSMGCGVKWKPGAEPGG
ncbi:MAG: thioredoxin family protein [Streptomycetales bacterium]